MQKFDAIRPFYDAEINEGIRSSINHPMMKALMNFTFPEMPDEVWKEQLLKTHSIRDFQCNFIYQSVQRVLAKSSDGLTTSGFEKLEKNTSYLFISNHRDIILDTSLLNASLFAHGLVMTASAIGDNLVKKSFLLTLARLNRNFLVQRGLGTGITIYAPSIILSSILGWNLTQLNIIIGSLVIIYTFSGGTKAVNVTQKHQMFVIMFGMIATFFLILHLLPNDMTFGNALHIAGANDKMNILDFSFNPESRYTFWSGITGGMFLMLSYFGTDQSQVGRYLSGKSVNESQKGLIMNGLLKVPMQFFILLTGVMVFVFFQFEKVPLNFNPNSKSIIENSPYKKEYKVLEDKLIAISSEKKEVTLAYASQLNIDRENKVLKNRIVALSEKEKNIRDAAKTLIGKANQKDKTNDADYIFIHYIINYLPKGLIGLLLAVILCAAMSSTASGISALASTTVIDIYKRNVKEEKSERHYMFATKYFTVMWGIIAILFACVGTLFENLIQLVNIVGSIFYGTVLGIFLVGFYIKYVKSNAIFWGAVLSQTTIFVIYYFTIHIYPSGQEKLGYLWLNFIGAMLTIILSTLFERSSRLEKIAKV
jgi:Na+/proline symporter